MIISIGSFFALLNFSFFRNTEKRKEKSRDAARSRRCIESSILEKLSLTLPLTEKEVSKIDKAGVMRLVISCIKLQSVIDTSKYGFEIEDQFQNWSLLFLFKKFNFVIFFPQFPNQMATQRAMTSRLRKRMYSSKLCTVSHSWFPMWEMSCSRQKIFQTTAESSR